MLQRSQFKNGKKLNLVGNAVPTLFEDPDEPEPVTPTTTSTSSPTQTTGSPSQPSSTVDHDPTPQSDPPSLATPAPTKPSSSPAGDEQINEPGMEKETTQETQVRARHVILDQHFLLK